MTRSHHTRNGVTRRGLLPLTAALPLLASCSTSETATVRFRVIAKVLIDRRPVEGSTVMQIQYTKVTKSLLGTGGSTTTKAEALILDLPGRGTVYILPCEHQRSGSLTSVYEQGLLHCLHIENGVGSMDPGNYVRLRAAKGRIPYDYRYPAMVAFTDEANPQSIYEIKPEQIGEWFQGVEFVGMELEFTDAPLTQQLRRRLKWLSLPPSQESWERDPPGHQRADSDRPIGFKITNYRFFGH